MRYGRTRSGDATFDLNLAPILDIIVSIVPLLLMSVVFVQIKMIETPVPQVVADAMNRADDKSQTIATLKISKAKGFSFEVTKDGQTKTYAVPTKSGAFDFEALQSKSFEVKQAFPQVFRLDLAPDEDVALNDLVKVMDSVRKDPAARKLAFVDPANGQTVETDVMFPNVMFSNIVGE